MSSLDRKRLVEDLESGANQHERRAATLRKMAENARLGRDLAYGIGSAPCGHAYRGRLDLDAHVAGCASCKRVEAATR
jgi:hypothetical protein